MMSSIDKINIEKSSSGITLIALMVTIVIILILSGIAVNMWTGDNGTIKKAEKARNDLEES